jgi:predicted nucleotidyltransferase
MTFSTHLLEEIEQQKLNDLENKRQEILQFCIIELKKYFKSLPVKSLYITGSLITPYKFRTHSDIDIVAEGFPPDKYFLAIAELEEILSRKVEIIELERCRFAQKIIKTGLKVI